MRNVTGQNFFGFMGKNTRTSLPRIGFRPREDPRRGVAADLAGLLACVPASLRGHGGRRGERIKPPPHTLRTHGAKSGGATRFLPLAAPVFLAAFHAINIAQAIVQKCTHFSARPFYFLAPLFLALKSPSSFPLCSFLASLSSAVL